MDAFDRLADALVSLTTREARRAAPQYDRFRVVKLNPLTFKGLTGSPTFDVKDDDVEVHAAVLRAVDDDDLNVGDHVEGREDAHGWVITGVVG